MINGFEITRIGTAPIFKYVIRKPNCARHVVMLDDEAGDIFVESDFGSYTSFCYSWGRAGRGTETLREFLTTAHRGYIADKFSYGKSRFCMETAIHELKKFCGNALEGGWGHPDDWPEEVVELIDRLDELNNSQSDLFYHLVMSCDEIMEAVGNDPSSIPSGNIGVNPEVKYWVDEVWPAFVEHLKNELADPDRAEVERAL